MARANFSGGTNWIVVYPDGGWGFEHLDDGEDAATKFPGLELHEVNRPPDDFETWNGKDGWRLDLEPIRRNRVMESRKLRDAELAAPAATEFGAVQTDQRSVDMLDRLARLARADAGFSTVYRFADNGEVELTAAELIELQLQRDRAMVEVMEAQFEREAKINAAKSRPAIAAADIGEAGK